jgi:glyceraldehyde 3-phosphate dehydrogenase
MKIAINGFGRIGRLTFRQLMEMDDVEIVAINDIAPLDNLAYLLRNDSVYVDPTLTIEAGEDELRWGEQRIRFTQIREPSDLPWNELEVETVIESTGRFTKRDDASKHLHAGAKRVIISAPSKEVDVTVCMGVNEEDFDHEKHFLISNASCTTNCLAPVAKVLDEEFGIITGFLTTVHALTASQSIVDAPAKKWARGRSAVANIVPTTTGAAIATTLVLPQLAGKLDGLAMRVPVPVGSVTDFVVQTEKEVTVEKVNDAFRKASHTTRMRNILGVSEDPLVSSDIIGSTLSALIDAQSTMVLGDHTVKVLALYDNEWGYARRLADLTVFAGRHA